MNWGSETTTGSEWRAAGPDWKRCPRAFTTRRTAVFACYCFSLEEDFMLWREAFWPAVCDLFNVQAVGEEVSTRQYRLTLHSDELLSKPEAIFRGEIVRLNSYARQKP